MNKPTKSIILTLVVLVALPSMLQAVPVAGFLGGLLSPTGAATNGINDRQYAWTIAGTGAAAGAEVTVTYTLSTSNGNLSSAFTLDNLFRYAPSANVPSGQDFTITIDQITVNAGWTLNSVAMSDTVTVAINGGNTARFSVNGGATFDHVGTGTGVSQQDVTNSQFEGFNGAGDSIHFLNVNQTANGGMNLRNLNMTIDVTAADPTVLAISRSGGGLDFEWNSVYGKQYDLLGSTTLDTSPDTWPVYDDGENVYENIAFSGTGTNSLNGVLPVGTRHFFVLREKPLHDPLDPSDKNILMISIDDLRPQIFAHDQNLHGISQMVTPNLDVLLAESVYFSNNYCQVPICGASRLSVMTGTRPYKQPGQNWGRHWTFSSRLDVANGNEPAGINHTGDTMVQHFKKHGFKTISVGGKIYHNQSDDNWDDLLRVPAEPFSGVLPYEIGDGAKTTSRGGTQYNNSEDNYYSDGWGAQVAIGRIETNKNNKWFMGYGVNKPHLPFWAPKKYWDLYPEDEITLPYNNYPPVNAPSQSLGNWGELRNYTGIPASGPLDDALAKTLIRGYYASVSYADAQIGKVIDKLKNTYDENGVRLYDKTIIVLWGDHGWNLSEHTLWCKHANYRTSLQSPLAIRDPSMPGGKVTQRLSELVDVYPTLCDLTGTGMPTTDHLEGTSLVPLMENPERPWKQAVFGRYNFGDTIITERYSYSEFVSQADGVQASMLYDLSVDPDENYNIADLNPTLSGELSALLGDGPVGKRNAWMSLVDTDDDNAPVTTSLELSEPIYPASDYP